MHDLTPYPYETKITVHNLAIFTNIEEKRFVISVFGKWTFFGNLVREQESQQSERKIYILKICPYSRKILDLHDVHRAEQSCKMHSDSSREHRAKFFVAEVAKTSTSRDTPRIR